MFHCIPRTYGKISDNVDEDTGVDYGIECPESTLAFGEKFEGGFWDPLLTWVRMLSITRENSQDRKDNLGTEDYGAADVRLFGFPRPSRGHMFVDPQTDNRWVVDSGSVKVFMLRGVTPVAYEAKLTLLQRNDPRYKLPMPDADVQDFRYSKQYNIGMSIS